MARERRGGGGGEGEGEQRCAARLSTASRELHFTALHGGQLRSQAGQVLNGRLYITYIWYSKSHVVVLMNSYFKLKSGTALITCPGSRLFSLRSC